MRVIGRLASRERVTVPTVVLVAVPPVGVKASTTFTRTGPFRRSRWVAAVGTHWRVAVPAAVNVRDVDVQAFTPERVPTRRAAPAPGVVTAARTTPALDAEAVPDVALAVFVAVPPAGVVAGVAAGVLGVGVGSAGATHCTHTTPEPPAPPEPVVSYPPPPPPPVFGTPTPPA